MKSLKALYPVLLCACLFYSQSASAQVASLESQCADLDGVIADSECVVTTIEVEDYAIPVRLAGKSGLAWTSVGVVETITIDTYTIVESVSEQLVYVPGNPSLPGCKSSGNQPKKCSDHYETQEVVSYSWEFASTESYENVVPTGCLNPAGKNMGFHKQCGF